MEVFIDPQEVLRYLGIRGEAPPGLLPEIKEMSDLVIGLSALSHTAARYEIRMEKGGVFVAASLFLSGEDIRRHLFGCTEVILMAATLGSGIEERMRLLQKTDMKSAVLFDACATSAIENFCDGLENAFRAEEQKRGRYLTSRFSPGYGDFPLDVQRDLCAVLQTEKRAGIAPVPSGMLVPQKSVTAIMGVSDKEIEKSGRRPCEKTGCEYYKDGVCGKA